MGTRYLDEIKSCVERTRRSGLLACLVRAFVPRAEHVKFPCLRVASNVYWYARACGVGGMWVHTVSSTCVDSMKDAVS